MGSLYYSLKPTLAHIDLAHIKDRDKPFDNFGAAVVKNTASTSTSNKHVGLAREGQRNTQIDEDSMMGERKLYTILRVASVASCLSTLTSYEPLANHGALFQRTKSPPPNSLVHGVPLDLTAGAFAVLGTPRDYKAVFPLFRTVKFYLVIHRLYSFKRAGDSMLKGLALTSTFDHSDRNISFVVSQKFSTITQAAGLHAPTNITVSDYAQNNITLFYPPPPPEPEPSTTGQTQ
ncbi:hypothetical protein HBI56_104610 [Parastagonospora nodorum]|uniref:Uncharacterized protein n=1 Tax=Phaeosphaeria nodorum (strain SN15 / ATCC MYA-4574 / FGSC 10173) TaxID=321614 RepID=A0A7U2FH04_PHANO|nr:hypothetical protein HBH56_134300 [Parastagonospora nodorum]QRD02681.1 hypothetical protein JI435_114170 [Parastagonospora nodorum SN15]KAH3926862.1 hypothetical protein HBH54_158990 [Parastagonospora nodorum]KAH3949201.1 hypothetical protein HBH53_089360 [Parastagonospora nodorum]KAH3958858.1 hypothetical protein HBH51_204510 [Parastagonospora nodorum]